VNIILLHLKLQVTDKIIIIL